MAKWIAPQGVKEVAVRTESGTKVYRQDKSGGFNVENPKHARQMKEEGFFQANAMGVIRHDIGFPCKNCGFGSLFKKCSRCGTENERMNNG